MKNKKIDIYKFGQYKEGLTDIEIRRYLRLRSDNKKVGELYRKFIQIAGRGNTGVIIDGEPLMYKHDVERFADVLFGVTKSTYWD